MKLLQYGMKIPNLTIDDKPAPYPVLNERDARAGAGIMLLLGAIAFVYAFILNIYYAIDILVLVFVLEFLLRIINPHIAPLYAIGRFTVRKMRPEYTGAAQKRFAWSLGLLMALTVATLIYGFGVRSMWNAGFCITCLGLMWLESSFGICVGCKIYHQLISWNIVKKPDVMPACPGGACPINKG